MGSGEQRRGSVTDPGGEVFEAAGNIRLLALDVDGVLTDGKITYSATGDEIKSFSVRDGHAVKLAVRAGLTIAIITGRQSPIVSRRAEELGIRFLYQGALDKRMALKDLLAETGLDPAHVAYMGDDVVDLPVLMTVGLGCSPSDADPEVLARASLVTAAKGGEGAVSELVRYILSAQGLWDGIMERYLGGNSP
jgi:3-deoxy-D-manno-octulosonate 8-phosphate phosphatase (KDO 8-P phosphatase)